MKTTVVRLSDSPRLLTPADAHELRVVVLTRRLLGEPPEVRRQAMERLAEAEAGAPVAAGEGASGRHI